MRLTIFIPSILLALVHSALAFPKFDYADVERAQHHVQLAKCNAGKQIPRRVVLPPPPSYTGLKLIPDHAHPFIPPGPGDKRGPCPALNTMANHGYISRNGVAKSEDIISAAMEAFNMGHDFAGFILSFATLARGNVNLGMLSIGGPSDLAPPLPDCIDGHVAGGLGTHGRFEGDVSSTRADHHIGDSVNFQNDLFDELLLYTGRFGDDGPDGSFTIINVQTFQEFKPDRFHQDQQEDRQIEFHIGRQLTAYSEVAFILDLFANGTTNTLSVQALGSIFRNQTFAPNWFRRASPAELPVLSSTASQVRNARPIPPGANDAQGNYILDTPPFTNFLCDGYADLIGNQVAGSLMETTGILKENVMTFVNAVHKPFHDTANCSKVFPHGPSGV